LNTKSVAVIGAGVVGTALIHGLQRLGHDVRVHDIKYNTNIGDIVHKTEACFICVPTPSTESGKCDTSVVEEVASELSNISYSGIVAIKSTVEPGTTKFLQQRYTNLNLCFVPEFLRERCAVSDFIDNHDLCVIGTESGEVFETIKQLHGYYPKKFIKTTTTEAELVKYFNNIYNATLIVFANNFYELCQELGANYTNVKNAVVNRDHITNSYLDCNPNLRGFGGVCLPKDTKAISHFVKSHKLPCRLFDTILEENDRYDTTVFSGMRKGEIE